MVGLDAALTTFDNQNEILVNNCTFRDNSATIAPAVYANEIKYSGLQPGVQLLLHDVIIENNNGQVENVPDFDSTVVGVVSMNMTLKWKGYI